MLRAALFRGCLSPLWWGAAAGQAPPPRLPRLLLPLPGVVSRPCSSSSSTTHWRRSMPGQEPPPQLPKPPLGHLQQTAAPVLDPPIPAMLLFRLPAAVGLSDFGREFFRRRFF